MTAKSMDELEAEDLAIECAEQQRLDEEAEDAYIHPDENGG